MSLSELANQFSNTKSGQLLCTSLCDMTQKSTLSSLTYSCLKHILKARPEANQILYLTSGLEDIQNLEKELNDTKKKQQANSKYDMIYIYYKYHSFSKSVAFKKEE